MKTVHVAATTTVTDLVKTTATVASKGSAPNRLPSHVEEQSSSEVEESLAI